MEVKKQKSAGRNISDGKPLWQEHCRNISLSTTDGRNIFTRNHHLAGLAPLQRETFLHLLHPPSQKMLQAKMAMQKGVKEMSSLLCV
jgi:hypothetical protein